VLEVHNSAIDLTRDYFSAKGINVLINRSEHLIEEPGYERRVAASYLIARLGPFYFICYDSLGSRPHSSGTSSGVYCSVKEQTGIDCRVFKKDRFDSILLRHITKTGSPHIDKQLSISSRNGILPDQILNPENVEAFLAFNEVLTPIILVLAHNHIDFVDDLKDRTILGLETNGWLFSPEDIDIFLLNAIPLMQRLQAGL
jgi:hypothetical protein